MALNDPKSMNMKEILFPQDVTIGELGFRPKEGHYRYLRYVSTQEKPQSLRTISKAIDVPFETIFDWLQDPAFQDWIAKNRNRFLRSQLQNVYSTMLEKALDGSAPHMKMFCERFDPLFSQQGRKNAGKNDPSEHDLLMFLMKRARCTKTEAVRLIAGKAKIREVDE